MSEAWKDLKVGDRVRVAENPVDIGSDVFGPGTDPDPRETEWAGWVGTIIRCPAWSYGLYYCVRFDDGDGAETDIWAWNLECIDAPAEARVKELEAENARLRQIANLFLPRAESDERSFLDDLRAAIPLLHNRGGQLGYALAQNLEQFIRGAEAAEAAKWAKAFDAMAAALNATDPEAAR